MGRATKETIPVEDTRDTKRLTAAEIVRRWDESGAIRTSLYYRMVQASINERGEDQ